MANAACSSSRTVVRSLSSTSLINLSTADSVAATDVGVEVLRAATFEPLCKYGPAAVDGWKSRYCSPAGDNVRTAAWLSAGMRVPGSMLMRADAPLPSSRMLSTLPTRTPR